MTALRWLAVPVALVAGSAAADGLDGERFTPATGAEGGFAVEHPAVPYHLGWSLGLFVHVADDQVVERAGDMVVTRPLDTGVTTDLVGSIGFFGATELGVHLPLHLVYDGDPYATGGTTLAANGGVGDLRLVPKVAIIRSGNAEHHVLLGMAVPVSFPTGDAEALRGANGVTIEPRLLFAAHVGGLGLGFDVGYKYRSEHPATLPWGNEITLMPWLAYGFTAALTGRIEVIAGKQVDTAVAGADFPVEPLAGLDYRTGHWDLYGGASLGLTDGIGDPDLRVVAGVRYRQDVPKREGFLDSDGDHVLDKDDRCPNDPEDEDGYRDADGCPDPDNDHDGVPDDDDECPELSGEKERRGCPAKTYVEITEGKIVIIGKVQFRSGSAEIDHNSDALLDQIAQALDANPQVGKIRIEGHTDNVGPPAMNLKLSQQRADSVKSALEKRGVSGSRLQTRGLGETRPLVPNTTGGGRQKNRRVEFIIVGNK